MILRQKRRRQAVARLARVGVAAALVVAFALCGLAAAGPPLVVEADGQFNLAQSLFGAGDFAGAMVEYRRFIHFFPDDPRVEDALYRIGRCHFSQGDYGRAIEDFYAVIDRSPSGRRTVDAYRAIAASYLKTDAPAQAVAVLERLITATADPPVRADAQYRIAWIYLDRGEWQRARDFFNRIEDPWRSEYAVGELIGELEKVPDIPRKNPSTAGLLALLPGAGHFYCGRYQDGLISLVVNGVLIAAAVEAFDNDLPILGGVIAAVEAGFYTGNIYSAVNSAHKYNRAQERGFVERLKKKAGPHLSLGVSRKGVTALVQIPF